MDPATSSSETSNLVPYSVKLFFSKMKKEKKEREPKMQIISYFESKFASDRYPRLESRHSG